MQDLLSNGDEGLGPSSQAVYLEVVHRAILRLVEVASNFISQQVSVVARREVEDDGLQWDVEQENGDKDDDEDLHWHGPLVPVNTNGIPLLRILQPAFVLFLRRLLDLFELQTPP